MNIRKITLNDLDRVFELLNELYKNKLNYEKFKEIYKLKLNDIIILCKSVKKYCILIYFEI